MPPQPLFQVIGATEIDHPAYLVRTGMFLAAKALFLEQLGWVMVREAGDIKTKGWRAVFVRPRGDEDSVTVQLTEDNGHPGEPMILPGVHLGIKVFDAHAAAVAFEGFCQYAGVDCEIESANPPEDTKWFVRIPQLFTFALELVSTKGGIQL